MKKNALIILIIGLVIAQIAIIAYAFTNENEQIVKDDYVAVFKGESGETVHSTYL